MHKQKALLLLHEGFEEIEAVTPLDVLRRAHVDVTMVSTDDKEWVKGAHDVLLKSDISLSKVKDVASFDALVIPGGPGIFSIRNKENIVALIRTFHSKKKWIAAICAAPLLLKDAGVLPTSYTAHFSVMKELPDLKEDAAVVVDANFLTSQGPGTALPFSLELVALLKSKELVFSLKQAMCLR